MAWICVLLCSASAALWWEKSISIIHVNKEAIRVQGKWGQGAKASFISACSEKFKVTCAKPVALVLHLWGEFSTNLASFSIIKSPVVAGSRWLGSVCGGVWADSMRTLLLVSVTYRLVPALSWLSLSEQSGLSNRKIWALGSDYFEHKCYLCIQYENYWFKAWVQWPQAKLG